MSNEKQLISVIIPCYNMGIFLDDAVKSVLAQTYNCFEIIIVNDGSTDPETRTILKRIDYPKTKVLHTENGGLAVARNRGIAASSGSIILPLDADDTIAPTYLEKGSKVFAEDAGVGVVYSLADRFGGASGLWDLPGFSPRRLLIENMVFCSAMFYRKDWEKVGGYNSNMKYGWEDWDYWLSICELGHRFVRIPEILFHCRFRSESMTVNMAYWHKFQMMMRLILNHPCFYTRQIMAPFLGRQ
jgi:glycosyltransferase involved in cell wall biosynthesis